MITAVKDPGVLTGDSGLRNLSNRMISAAPVKTLISQRCHNPKKLLEPWVRHPWSCCQDRLSRAGQQHLVTSAETCSQMKHPCFHREQATKVSWNDSGPQTHLRARFVVKKVIAAHFFDCRLPPFFVWSISPLGSRFSHHQ